jgi:Protein of unknown function (DUF3108)
MAIVQCRKSRSLLVLRLTAIILFGLFPSAPAVAQAGAQAGAKSALNARFDVHVYGIKVGEMRIAASFSAAGYSATARFATTGFVALLKDIRLQMKTTGTRTGTVLQPLLYSEDVNTGRRSSSAQLRYSDGIPALTGGRSEPEDGIAPLDPAQQRGTLDPLTAMILTLRDQPADVQCQLDLQVFDGARRTRILLGDGTPEDRNPVCTGQFMRVAGYSAERLATNGQVPLRITYTPDGAGQRVHQLRLNTSRGPVTLTRR